MESFDALLPPEVARRAEEVGVVKARLPIERMAVLAVLGGAFIALGAMFSTVVTAGGGLAPGVSRLLGGFVFSLGLVLVVVAGAELFTGNTLLVMALVARRISPGELARAWLIVYLGNAVGALATALLVFWSGHYRSGNGAVGLRALEIGAAKTSLGFGEAVVSGVLANTLVCLAVWLSLAGRTVVDKVVAIVLPVSAFVAAGFEHSIANLYFIPFALGIKAWGSEAFWSTIGTDADAYGGLTWGRFLVGNQLPVVIGNIVGGALLVGLVYWVAYRRSATG